MLPLPWVSNNSLSANHNWGAGRLRRYDSFQQYLEILKGGISKKREGPEEQSSQGWVPRAKADEWGGRRRGRQMKAGELQKHTYLHPPLPSLPISWGLIGDKWNHFFKAPYSRTRIKHQGLKISFSLHFLLSMPSHHISKGNSRGRKSS